MGWLPTHIVKLSVLYLLATLSITSFSFYKQNKTFKEWKQIYGTNKLYGRKGNGKAKLQTSHIYIDFMKNICVALIQFNI